MAELKEEDLEKFMDVWTEPSQEFDPEDFDPAGVELKAAWLDFEHAGRYSLKFRNQGFDVSGFGESSTDDGRRTCPFWRYVSSPDVNYYDAEFELEKGSPPAYGAALYLEAFSDAEAFSGMSDALGDLFDAVRRRDAAKAAAVAKRNGFGLSPDGAVALDCYDRFGIVVSMRVFPAASV